jgi:hypothetical protein
MLEVTITFVSGLNGDVEVLVESLPPGAECQPQEKPALRIVPGDDTSSRR